MTPDEAVKRAEEKLKVGVLDSWDIQNLVNSVYNTGLDDGHRFAYQHMKSFIERQS